MAKKKKDAHHGGAWKVAYADFVTAMMALFMVLWICAQDKKIMLATSKYFKQPFSSVSDRSGGILGGKESGSSNKDESRETATAANLAFLNALASELNKMINARDVLEEKAADMQVTSDGLKITLYDRTKHAIFKKNTAEITDWGQLTLQNLAWIIDRNDLKVYIDGHTSSGDDLKNPNYGPWELSADRANAARRLLVKYAVNAQKIERVTGYAATKPLGNNPGDASSNERITISLSANR
ncbi:MAG: OmpA family protein [Chthoniobacter sp.]|nr:OmpA family protein [Chthoniobacter sp.]